MDVCKYTDITLIIQHECNLKIEKNLLILTTEARNLNLPIRQYYFSFGISCHLSTIIKAVLFITINSYDGFWTHIISHAKYL